MGKNHARVLSELPETDGVFLFDPLGAQLGSIGGLKVQSDLEKFLEQSMDYCVVSSPTGTHLSMGLKLAERGIPALIEKPLAVSEKEGVQLVNAFRSAGLIAGVGHVERFNPAILKMKSLLADGVLGELYQISTRRIGPYSGRIKDVGVARDLASHDVDLVSWLCDSSYENLDSRTLSPLGNPHEDMLVAIGALGNGIVVSHLVNWMSPTKERVTSVLGEKGMLVADTLAVDLILHEMQPREPFLVGEPGNSVGSKRKIEIENNEPLYNEHLAFQIAIKTGSDEGIPTLNDGLAVLRVTDRLASP
jgi:predicted dehydrogenase